MASVDITKLSQSELDALIRQAQDRKENLHREQLDTVRGEVIAFARERGYSIEELFGKASRAKKGGKRGVVPPKYRNPANAEQTWTGRGKRPRWFQGLLDSGKKEADLLIK
ncbi:MAG: H-NS histone family protein [Xanthomonadales bacterium]|nr:H-NS histone family protein [Xanthomonadales bacterium]